MYPLNHDSTPSLQSSQYLKHTAHYFKVTGVTFQNKTAYYNMNNAHLFLERTGRYPSLGPAPHTGLRAAACLYPSPLSGSPTWPQWKKFTSPLFPEAESEVRQVYRPQRGHYPFLLGLTLCGGGRCFLPNPTQTLGSDHSEKYTCPHPGFHYNPLTVQFS